MFCGFIHPQNYIYRYRRLISEMAKPKKSQKSNLEKSSGVTKRPSTRSRTHLTTVRTSHHPSHTGLTPQCRLGTPDDTREADSPPTPTSIRGTPITPAPTVTERVRCSVGRVGFVSIVRGRRTGISIRRRQQRRADGGPHDGRRPIGQSSSHSNRRDQHRDRQDTRHRIGLIGPLPTARA